MSAGGNGKLSTLFNISLDCVEKMRRFLNMEKKSLEIWTDDFKGADSFSITERAHGRPHVVEFDGGFCEQAINFLNMASSTGKDVSFWEVFHAKGGSFFLTRGKNARGWFTKMTVWRKDSKNSFIIIPAYINFSGWSNLAFVLRQMVNAKKVLGSPPRDVVPAAKMVVHQVPVTRLGVGTQVQKPKQPVANRVVSSEYLKPFQRP